MNTHSYEHSIDLKHECTQHAYTQLEEASGGDILREASWSILDWRRDLEASWRHLEGGIWEASGRHLEASGGIWEAYGDIWRKHIEFSREGFFTKLNSKWTGGVDIFIKK
jgi:hypothetical protein